MFGNKKKAFTLSYDDGVMQDARFIELLNKYGLKATFNLNSGLFGQKRMLEVKGVPVKHHRFRAEDIRYVYEGHEIAAHTVTHAMLPKCTEKEIICQVEDDRIALSELAGYEVVGMAYANGGENNNDEVARIIKERTNIQYCRTISNTGNFDLQTNLYRFHPSVFHMHMDEMFTLGERFINLQPEEPQIFYVWGHTYELDAENSWSRFEEFCQMMSGHTDIFYGTNREILLQEIETSHE